MEQVHDKRDNLEDDFNTNVEVTMLLLIRGNWYTIRQLSL